MRKFPPGVYGRQRLTFFPAPYRAPLRAFATLGFVWHEERVLVCDIEGRGWCIPSGRVDPGESSCEAIKREAKEEGGAILRHVQYIGCYHISERREVRWADCYAAEVEELGEIGMPEESKGRQLCTLEELPELYHAWNELTDRVFQHSREILARVVRKP